MLGFFFLCTAYAPHRCSAALSVHLLPWSGAGAGDATHGRSQRWQAATWGQAGEGTCPTCPVEGSSDHRLVAEVWVLLLTSKTLPGVGEREGKAPCCTWAACSGQGLGHPRLSLSRAAESRLFRVKYSPHSMAIVQSSTKL